jgi:L-fuconolactonase
MDAAGVDRVVIVPPSWEGDRNDLALEAARLRPHRLAIIGRLPIEKPESRQFIDGWRRQPGMLGVRLTFRGPYRSRLTDGAADRFWTAAERAGVPAMVFVPGLVP